MKNPLRFLCAAFAAVAASHVAPAANVPQQRPNVLFIAIDDLRDWVGYFQHNLQAKTPNLDRFSKMGESFSHAYCAAPVCNPSRAALMSGLRPYTTGVYDNNNDWRLVIPVEITLTTAFRNAGYFVCGAGKIYHEAYRRVSDWDEYLQNEGGLPRVPAGQSDGVGGIKFAPLDAAKDEDFNDWHIVDYGIEQLGKKHDKPFFLAVGVHKPHMPWNVPRKYYDMFPLESIQLPPYREDDLDDIPPAGVRMAHPETDHIPMQKSGRWKEAVQGYLAAIAYTDMNLGRLLDAFEKSAYRDNTIICLWGDHGWHLGEKHHWRKFALWEESTRSPLIWVVPGLTKPGSICARPIDFMAIYPTLTDLCGIPTPKHVEGESIRPLLANPAAPWDKFALTTYRYMNHTVRVADWRYIRYANGDEELYNDAQDENEWTNLALKPEFAAKKAELAKYLPDHNHADIGGARGAGEEDFGNDKAAKKAKRQAKKNNED
jgi:arylsulfatase A-like enzyme